MSNERINLLSQEARYAASNYNWQVVAQLSDLILKEDKNSSEGHFLRAMALKAGKNFVEAREHFELCLKADGTRYDAAIELAALYSSMRRNEEAFRLVQKHEDALVNSPRYLDAAATTYVGVGMPEKAWPLYQKANALQPDVDLFQANLAACAVYVGELDVAKVTYRKLINNNPGHRRNHNQYSRVAKATNESHINEMKALLKDTSVHEDRNMPLYFAIGKEYEDLKRWDECFEYYSRGCAAVSEKINYTATDDIALIDSIIEICDAKWFASAPVKQTSPSKKTPIFITGLPRTGTTLVERILSSHSQVSSLGETMFMQMSLKDSAGISKAVPLNVDNIAEIANADLSTSAENYLNYVGYRLGTEPNFIEKLPFNFLYLGLIAKAWPDAKIVVLNRNPMDACFSMFKQVFTYVYKFSYSLEHLGKYYVAYHRLLEHWREVLGDRLVEVDYEALVEDQYGQTTTMLDKLGLGFEQACIDFEKNSKPSTTASSVQVRSKVNSSAVDKWKNFETQLEPLRAHLEANNIPTQ